MDAALATGDLLSSARSGDASAFGLLLEPLWEPAYQLAFSMLRDREAAEDAVQDAGLRAWRGIRRVRPDTKSIRPWFLTIVANQCRSTRSRPWWRVLRVAELPETAPARQVDALEDIALVRALRELRADYRVILALRYFVDLPMEEVATILGISVPAAKSRVLRALKALQPLLSDVQETK